MNGFYVYKFYVYGANTRDKCPHSHILSMSDTDIILVFVYNADSGLLNALKDGVIKIVSPSSYQCRLCGLTFGTATMKSEWRKYIDGINHEVKFLHKDEFHEQYEYPEAEFPSAYVDRKGALELFISVDEMNSNQTLSELIQMVQMKLAQIEME